MKIKNKTRFRVLCALYVIGYLFFCILGGMNSGMMISDSPALNLRLSITDCLSEFGICQYLCSCGLSSRSSLSLLSSGRPTCQNKS